MEPTQRTWVLDSLEEGVASVDEGGRMIRLPSWLLPAGAREGDLLRVGRSEDDEGVRLTIRIDRQATEEALRRSRAQVEASRSMADPGGDIVL